jgi:LAO/AO transport system kinase
VHPIAQKVLARDLRGVARACRLVDDRVGGHLELLKDLFPHTGKAWIVGVTGNPGAGKSTVTDRLVERWRAEGKRVGVIAVDPTSPYSGGAILGDRIRMQRHFEDPDVFIRSLATRGELGGLSRSAVDVMRVLDAWGADVVVVETVGVGQDEMEVTRAAHSTLIVVAPGLGDDVQAAKAGILECGDVFAVNKADRDGADAAVRDLELMVALGRRIMEPAAQPSAAGGHIGAAMRRETAGADGAGGWIPPVLRTVATDNRGMQEAAHWLDEHRKWVMETPSGQQRRRERLRQQMENEMRNALVDAALRDIRGQLEEAVQQVSERKTDPYTACDALVAAFRRC